MGLHRGSPRSVIPRPKDCFVEEMPHSAKEEGVVTDEDGTNTFFIHLPSLHEQTRIGVGLDRHNVITEVHKDSIAHKLGVMPGDRIVAGKDDDGIFHDLTNGIFVSTFLQGTKLNEVILTVERKKSKKKLTMKSMGLSFTSSSRRKADPHHSSQQALEQDKFRETIPKLGDTGCSVASIQSRSTPSPTSLVAASRFALASSTRSTSLSSVDSFHDLNAVGRVAG